MVRRRSYCSLVARTRLYRGEKLVLEDFPVEDISEHLKDEGACVWLDYCDQTKAELATIESAHADMVAAWKAKDYVRYFARNRQIHDTIMAAARNNALLAVYRSLSGRVQNARVGLEAVRNHTVHA